MKMYYFVDKSGRYLGAFSDGVEFPDERIEIPEAPASADQPWLFPGWGASPSAAIAIIGNWRELQFPIIANQLNAIEEAEAGVPPPDLLPGDRKDWLRYRGAVRNWAVGTPGYPDRAKRPVVPSVEPDQAS